MQVELLDRQTWRTRVELANAIFEYLEIFHNRQRRYSGIGHAYPSRVRDSASDSDSGLKSSNSTPRDPGQPTVSTEVRAVQRLTSTRGPAPPRVRVVANAYRSPRFRRRDASNGSPY